MSMRDLIQFMTKHTARSRCQCGCCITDGPNKLPSSEHTVDMVFFNVMVVGSPDPDEFRRLVTTNKAGEFCDVDLFDGKEHNYMELGGWIGDQGVAMQLMALGQLLGLWRVITPLMLGLPADLAMQMAGAGMVSMIAPNAEAEREPSRD